MDRETIIDGLKIHYGEQGSGQPLLLIHGLGGPLMWQRVTPLLAERFRVIVVHLPGFGESDAACEPYSTVQFANFLHHFIHTLGLQTPSLVGVSYGGQICLSFSSLHPAAAGKLILLAPTGIPPRNSWLSGGLVWPMVEFFGMKVVLRSRFLLCTLSRRSFHHPGRRPADLCEKVYRHLRTPGSRSAWMKALWSTLTEQAELVRDAGRSVLMVWGRQDRTVPMPTREEIPPLLIEAPVTILEDCGHSLTLEKPQEVSQAIADFLM